ncbi:MAG: hypothetical protein RL088_480 [Verrucomicrobiota bacterium]
MIIRPILALCVIGFASQGAAQTPVEEPAPRRGTSVGERPIRAAVPRLPIIAQAAFTAELPPLPEGVEDLKFADFYKMPVGPRGLEPTERLLALDGKKVRLSGFFVFEDWATCTCPDEPATPPKTAAARRAAARPKWMKHVVPGRIMFAPLPVTVSLGHYGLADDLPAQVAFLDVVPRFGEPVFYQPGIFSVIGTLSLGHKQEIDGRISHVRVKVEKDTDIVRLAASLPRQRQVSQTGSADAKAAALADSASATPTAPPPEPR